MRYKLKEIFDLQMGKTPSRKNLDYWNTKDYKWISIADLSQTRKYISDTKEYLSCSAVEESGIKVIPANTVVMSFKLSIGKIAITSEDMYSNEAIMAFHDKHVVELLPEYIYYMFLCKNWDEGSNKAAMGKTLNKATLSEVEINICSVVEQREIVDVLDKIMRIMSDREEEIKLLDDLIKSRFVEMFGDSEKNTNSFPVEKLGNLCNVRSSKRIYQSEQCSKGVPFLRISDLSALIDKASDTSNLYISDEKYTELFEQGLVPSVGDVLITSRGTLGKCYIIKENDRFYFQDGMISWLSNISDRITSLYLSYLFSMTGIQKQIINLQAGSTVAYLSISMLKKLDIMIPPKKMQERFAAFVAQTDKSKLTIQKSLDELETLNKALMQKYFGGNGV